MGPQLGGVDPDGSGGDSEGDTTEEGEAENALDEEQKRALDELIKDHVMVYASRHVDELMAQLLNAGDAEAPPGKRLKTTTVSAARVAVGVEPVTLTPGAAGSGGVGNPSMTLRPPSVYATPDR